VRPARSGRHALAILLLLVVALLGGCASLPPGSTRSASDPFERFNRSVYAFNDTLDTYALKPAAQGYRKVVPELVRTGVDNVFGNFSDAWSTVNHLLQGKLATGMRMGMRVLTNTTIGLGGLLDPASEMGMDKESEDFGQTLGRWGVPPGPYLVLPVFGPSDLRDAVALPLDRYVSPALVVPTTAEKVGVTVLGAVATRASLLDASQMLDDIALDRYSFLRDAYIARRRSLVYDGNPPDEPDPPDAAPAEPPAAAVAVPPAAAAAASTPASAPVAPAAAPPAPSPASSPA